MTSRNASAQGEDLAQPDPKEARTALLGPQHRALGRGEENDDEQEVEDLQHEEQAEILEHGRIGQRPGFARRDHGRPDQDPVGDRGQPVEQRPEQDGERMPARQLYGARDDRSDADHGSPLAPSPRSWREARIVSNAGHDQRKPGLSRAT